MATQHIRQPAVPGQAPQHYDYQAAYEHNSVELPMRSNLGLITGLLVTFASLVTLIVYYVL
jgi:hypothetical protein